MAFDLHPRDGQQGIDGAAIACIADQRLRIGDVLRNTGAVQVILRQRQLLGAVHLEAALAQPVDQACGAQRLQPSGIDMQRDPRQQLGRPGKVGVKLRLPGDQGLQEVEPAVGIFRRQGADVAAQVAQEQAGLILVFAGAKPKVACGIGVAGVAQRLRLDRGRQEGQFQRLCGKRAGLAQGQQQQNGQGGKAAGHLRALRQTSGWAAGGRR